MPGKIKVHIIDDSATVRVVLKELLESDNSIEVIGISSDPVIAEKRLEKEWPDVFILDVEMPHKDGITFLKEIMAKRPTPVVMCSALTANNARVSMEALSAGAVEIISKPQVGVKGFLHESAVMLIDSVKAASHSDVKRLARKAAVKEERQVQKKLTADAVLSPWDGRKVRATKDKLVAIGASAGGTQAIEEILTALPVEVPGIVIVQHMPEKFTKAFAERLNNICGLVVKEATEGDYVASGTALIAPGNFHMVVERQNDRYRTVIKEGPLVSRHRPSVDVLFRSVAKTAGSNALGIILTGMGDDGANGMVEMKNAGIDTIAQNEETCLVYGMPREAVKRGAVNRVLALDDISREIIEFY